MDIIQIGTDNWIPIKIISSVDLVTPITGLLWNAAGLSVLTTKNDLGDGAKTLTADDWVEVSSGTGVGTYLIKVSSTDTDTLGLLVITVKYTNAVTYTHSMRIVRPAQVLVQ